MKDEIKTHIITQGILYPKFNRNIARNVYWANINESWHDYIFSNYSFYKKSYPITFANFLRLHFFDENIAHYTGVEDFLKTTECTQVNPNTKNYRAFYKEALKFINFDPKNFTEIIYCYRLGLKDRPKCVECSNNTEFTVFNSGYRSFCSQGCQINHNNKEKKRKLSQLPTEELVKIIRAVPYELRNTTNTDIASAWLNILEFTRELSISDKERTYLFVHQDLSLIECPICKKPKKFKSQNVGYTKTCTRIACKNTNTYDNYYNELSTNNFYGKGGSSYSSGFLYVLYSEINDFYKIGIAQNPLSRLVQLRNSIEDFEFYNCSFLNKNLHTTEQYLHGVFKDSRVSFELGFDGSTEIFNLTEDNLQYIQRYIYENQ